jgi:hypothetical protein
MSSGWRRSKCESKLRGPLPGKQPGRRVALGGGGGQLELGVRGQRPQTVPGLALLALAGLVGFVAWAARRRWR